MSGPYTQQFPKTVTEKTKPVHETIDISYRSRRSTWRSTPEPCSQRSSKSPDELFVKSGLPQMCILHWLFLICDAYIYLCRMLAGAWFSWAARCSYMCACPCVCVYVRCTGLRNMYTRKVLDLGSWFPDQPTMNVEVPSPTNVEIPDWPNAVFLDESVDVRILLKEWPLRIMQRRV